MARRLFRRLWRLTTARIFFTNHACMQPSSSCVQSQSSCMQAKPVLQTGVSSLPAESCLWKYIDVHKVSAWACTTCSRSCPVSSVAGEATLGTAKLQPVVAAQGSNSWTLQAWVAAQARPLFVPAALWAEEVGAPLSPFLLLEQVQRQVGHSFLKGLSVQGAFPLLLLSLFLQVSGLLQQVLWPKALVLAWPLPVGPWPWFLAFAVAPRACSICNWNSCGLFHPFGSSAFAVSGPGLSPCMQLWMNLVMHDMCMNVSTSGLPQVCQENACSKQKPCMQETASTAVRATELTSNAHMHASASRVCNTQSPCMQIANT